ncbi:DUF58 domain-containing protein [Nocardioides sp. B-3]|uniref:DUF58 domain-containing protein n=1 Tax=Nocardioides sp. B-3 TaxID=2895565 RepID=UPI002152AE7B|nr:DUF58 domain-containing protein [Nocardioides sp. B-3]UUZ59656.1 DUF58 domain-containing protein [Nocardioides sp. B-3]
MLLLEDHLPYVPGTRPRFVLEGIGHGWRRHVTYRVRSDVRGQFEIGPMTVRVTDPFGLIELGRAFHTTAPLTVTPRTVALPGIPIGGARTGSGDNRPRAFAIGSAEDVTVREYRRGDDLRRVHWRSSARVGELMVRREEQPRQSRATVFLDNRLVSHRGRGVASSLEAAVSAAASIAVHLSQRGYAARPVTASGEDPGTAWHSRTAAVNTAPLLEALAVVQIEHSPHLDTAWLAEPGHGGLLIAVLRKRQRQRRTVPQAAPAPRGHLGRDHARRRRVGTAPRTVGHRVHVGGAGQQRLAGRDPAPARPPRSGLAGARASEQPAEGRVMSERSELIIQHSVTCASCAHGAKRVRA